MAPSDLNDVWVLPEIVVRIARAAGASNLRYEAAIAPVVPECLQYPGVLAFGQVGDHDWIVTRRVGGTTLDTAWASLSHDAAIEALDQFVTKLESLHSVTDAPEHLRRLPALYVFDPGHAAATLDDVVSRGWILPSDANRLEQLHATMLRSLDDCCAHCLVHGDAHLGNVMWENGRLTSIIDLEGAGIAPADLDFHKLYIQLREKARHTQAQPQSVSFLAERWARMHVSPGAKERLAGYSVARWLWAAQMTLQGRFDPAVTAEVKFAVSDLLDHDGWHL
jgi:aminoglycoside phosphotransferase (APT) family kinase protein